MYFLFDASITTSGQFDKHPEIGRVRGPVYLKKMFTPAFPLNKAPTGLEGTGFFFSLLLLLVLLPPYYGLPSVYVHKEERGCFIIEAY